MLTEIKRYKSATFLRKYCPFSFDVKNASNVPKSMHLKEFIKYFTQNSHIKSESKWLYSIAKFCTISLKGYIFSFRIFFF